MFPLMRMKNDNSVERVYEGRIEEGEYHQGGQSTERMSTREKVLAAKGLMEYAENEC